MTLATYDDLFTAPAPALAVKADPEGRLEGYASTFGGEPDRQGDVIAAGAFTKSLAAGPLPAMLWGHDMAAPIGRWTEAREDAKGLHVRGVLNLKTTAGRDAFEHVRAGDATGLSIGYRIPDGGRTYGGKGTFILTEVVLFEVSVVAVPANPHARITGLKTLGSKSELIDLLHESGLPRKAAQRVAAGGWAALSGEDHEAGGRAFAETLDTILQRLRTP